LAAEGGSKVVNRGERKTMQTSIMNQGTKRTIIRWIHIVFSIPILGYIYSPFEEIPNYAPAVRFVFLPILVMSGFWMWKGHLLRRLISKRSSGRLLPSA
jgi:hypothetical protein